MTNAAGLPCCTPTSTCMAHAWGLPDPRWSGMSRAMAEEAIRLHKMRVPLPEDYFAEVKRVLASK